MMTQREALVNEWVRTLHAMIDQTASGVYPRGSAAREPFIEATLALLRHLSPPAPEPDPKEET
jgi:hypothetical protein